MTEPKWTPGRWRFSKGNLLRVYVGEVSVCGIHRIGRDKGKSADETIANGYLIAAAPKLYSALKNLMTYKVGDRDAEDAAINVAEEALAQAEGRS